MTRKRKPKIIHLSGRRWFSRGPGNTYCTCAIYVDGECVQKIGPTYGYGDFYAHAGGEWLNANGYTPKREEHEPLWRYCQDHNIKLTSECADVARERDL